MLVSDRRSLRFFALCFTILLAGSLTLPGAAQQLGGAGLAAATPSLHAAKPRRLMIRNAMVIYGSGRPLPVPPTS
jgi:hypothetical protein